jgi:BASS family bile acid:Na+ symporter
MTEVLATNTRTAMIGFLIAGLLERGLSLSLQQVIAALRKGRLVLMALLLNLIVVPLLALRIAKGLSLESSYAIGRLLVGLAPGAPFIPKIKPMTPGDLAFATALMVRPTTGRFGTRSRSTPTHPEP